MGLRQRELVVTRTGILTSVSSSVALAALTVAIGGFHGPAFAASAKAAGGTAAESIAERFSSTSRDEARRKADEQDMLSRARKEAEEAKRNARTPLDGTVSPAAATDVKSEQVSKPVNIGTPTGEDMKRLEAARQAELQRLSEKLRKASQARAMPAPKPVDTPWTTEVTQAPKDDLFKNERSALGMAGDPTDIAASRVTVLMVMTPGDRGIRRFDKHADPVLCTNDGCYISQGPSTPARFLTTHKALGFGNTFGLRAGACREQLSCVFRSVDLGRQPSFVQPVDMRMVHHDRREIKQVSADESCRIDAGRLTCSRPVRASNYTLWIVPEKIAQRAGVEAMSRALTEGLGRAQAALQ